MSRSCTSLTLHRSRRHASWPELSGRAEDDLHGYIVWLQGAVQQVLGDSQRDTVPAAAALREQPHKAGGCSIEAMPTFKGTAAEVSYACLSVCGSIPCCQETPPLPSAVVCYTVCKREKTRVPEKSGCAAPHLSKLPSTCLCTFSLKRREDDMQGRLTLVSPYLIAWSGTSDASMVSGNWSGVCAGC